MSKDGLCAIITGSASGLGAATALILAKGGARLVINYSSSQKEAEETADLCRKAGGEVVVVQGDVSRDEDCRKIVAAAAPWGRLDALINNAGITSMSRTAISTVCRRKIFSACSASTRLGRSRWCAPRVHCSKPARTRRVVHRPS
jgi:NAD(P)-dependent dehydrogenase (short-subunit alcohol dehydrogenase family)